MMKNEEHKVSINCSAKDFGSLLDDAIIGRLCVQAWLGYGDALFIGFGEKILSPPTQALSPTGKSYLKHAQPPYEIQTYSSDWFIKKDTSVAVSLSNNLEAEYVISSLVGTKATGWKFVQPSWGLSIIFNNGYLLEIKPKNITDDSYSDAWGLRTPDNFYSIFRLNGDCYRVHGDMPES